jgi:hypothetical protein
MLARMPTVRCLCTISAILGAVCLRLSAVGASLGTVRFLVALAFGTAIVLESSSVLADPGVIAVQFGVAIACLRAVAFGFAAVDADRSVVAIRPCQCL